MERNFVSRLMKENLKYLEDVKSSSKDPYTQVGCILFDKIGHKIAVGVNKSPKGWNTEEYPWNDRELKNKFVIHAELDACSNINYYEGMPIYALVSLFPCLNCAKTLIEHGVKQIYYRDIRFNDDASLVMALCHQCGVKLIRI